MDDEKQVNSADEKQVKEKEKAVKKKINQDIADIKWQMSTPQGRRVMWRLLSDAGIFSASFVPRDASQTAFNEGRRSYGTKLLVVIMQHCNKQYLQMVDENSTEEN